jgi:hypothetical protein
MADEEYGSYDPTVVKQVSDAGPVVLKDPDGNELPSFNPKVADDLDGLLFLGALTKRFEWLGHVFVIRTLSQDEVLTVPILMKPWQGSIGEVKAYATAMVAMCIQTVDGKELPMPYEIEKTQFTWAQQRFDYVRRSWFQYTIDKVYSEYMALEGRTQQVVDAMGEAFGSTENSTDGLSDESVEPTDEVS